MSVRLDEYCETSQSKFAKALKLAIDRSVLLRSDEVEFYEELAEVRAEIMILYALSMNDFKKLLDVFDKWFWRIEPINDTYSFKFVIYLKPNDK